MTPCSDATKSHVTDEILLYLRNHPNAADTLHGILNWWLPRQRYETERERVEQGLEALVARGLVSKKVLGDGTVLYMRSDDDALTNN